MMLKCKWYPIFASFSFLWVSANNALAEQMINVAIASSTKSLEIAGKNIKLISQNEKILSTADAFKLSVKSKQIVIGGKSLAPPLRFSSEYNIEINKKKFRGEIVVVVDQRDGDSMITLVHPMSIETYVAGIIAGEMPASWPDEALKAQAIASRTYAIWQKFRRIDKSYHLDSSVLDQVYRGLDNDHDRAIKAAQDTAGLVLTYEAKPIIAYFHSSCGGKTASAQEGWGSDLAYLPGGKCDYCDPKVWKYQADKLVFEKALGLNKKENIIDIKMGSKTDSGRVENIELILKNSNKKMNVIELRKKLGYSNLRSTHLDEIEVSSREIAFYGKGYGHGVGMCQWGANGMAKAGCKAQDILTHYYPGSELRKLY